MAKAGYTNSGTPEIQWLNPKAFTSTMDPNTGAGTAGETVSGGNVLSTNDNAQSCQFAASERNNVFGPRFFWRDLSVAKSFKVTENVRFRVSGTFYNTLNHEPGLPDLTGGRPLVTQYALRCLNDPRL